MGKETYRQLKHFSDGSVLLEHRDETGFLLARYIGYYDARHRTYRLYPARGESHYKCKVHTISAYLVTT